MHTVMGLANMKEQSTNQQEHIQQRNIDNQQTIHYTIQNAMKLLSTIDVFTPATNLTPLALNMLGSNKKDNALNVVLLTLNDRGFRAQITPNILDKLFTGNTTPRKTFEPAASIVFYYAASFEGTCLEDMEISILVQRNQADYDLQTLSDKEKEVLFQDTIIVARYITQLINILNIFAYISEEYSGQVYKLYKFVRGCHSFVKANEERLSGITNNIKKDLPPHIQSFVSQVTS